MNPRHALSPDQPLSVLLVEDDAGDVMIAREALAAGRLSTDLHVVVDGVEAMSYLRQGEGYADATRPDLILLDLNLPRKSGHEVLAEVKQDPKLRRIPVVVLTTSHAQSVATLAVARRRCRSLALARRSRHGPEADRGARSLRSQDRVASLPPCTSVAEVRAKRASKPGEAGLGRNRRSSSLSR
jgi:CheY-like chemotaxis protein